MFIIDHWLSLGNRKNNQKRTWNVEWLDLWLFEDWKAIKALYVDIKG